MEHYLKLSRRLQLFVDAYVETGSAAAAARKIRPLVDYPRSLAHKMLAKPGVKEAIEERTKEAIAEAGVTHLRTIQEVARVAFFDHRKIMDESGALLPMHQWPADVSAALAGVEVETLFEGRGEAKRPVGTVHKYRAWPKVDALKLLMQYQKLLVERHEHSGPGGKPLQPPNIAISFEGGGPGSEPDDAGIEVSNDAPTETPH